MKNITKVMAMILSVLIAITALPMAVFAEELSALAENGAVALTSEKTYEDITDVLTVKYCLEDTYSWSVLPSGRVLDHINGIRLQTDDDNFYLKYRSKNSGVGWLPQVISTESGRDDFAGSEDGPMTNLSIEVYTAGGTRLYDDYVVMYRAKVAGEWLEWVSNGTPTAMETIKSEYGLSGTLDKTGTNAGWASKGNIQQLEIKLYKKTGTTYSGSENGEDFEEITGNISMYYRGTSSSQWESINNGIATFDQMEGLLLQTSPSYPYYFSYAAKDATHGWNSYVSSRKSGISDYAGYTYPVTNIGIRVYAYNTRVYDNYVVMYRAKAENTSDWLDWVSNAKPEIMYAIKTEFDLEGNLDTSSTDAGDARYGHITALEIRVYRRKNLTVKPGANATVISGVPYINQYENNFPNGCESASTVMALQYLVGADKISFKDFVDTYLDKTSATPVKNGIGPDPNEVYMGNPWGNESAWGCFAPVIVNAVKKLEANLGIHVTNLTGHSFGEFTQYIDRGIPVIIWGRVDMGGAGNVWTWTTSSGKSISYPGNLHCLLLIGYDSEYYYFNDPMREANIGYTKASVEAAYNDLQKQAIVIERGSSTSGSAVVKPIADTVVTKKKEIEKTPSLSDEYHADPIDLGTGAHVIDNTLLSIEGAKTLSFSVSYRSDLLTDSSVGRGWSHNYEKHVEYDSESDRIYVYDNATYYAVYEKAEDSDVYTTETVTKDNYTVTKSSVGYTVNCNYAKSEYYDTEGRLVKLADKGGLATVLTYGENTVTVTDEVSGKYLVLTKSEGKITSVSDSSGRTVTIGYVDGSLGSITDENGNVLSYSYNENGQIEKGRDKNGTVFFTDEYDSMGRVVRQTDAADIGNVTVIEYTGFKDGELSTVTVTDRTDTCTVYGYTDKKQLVSKTDPVGSTVTYEYDEKGHLTKKTDAKGNSDIKVYDDSCNLVYVTDKLGYTTEFTYDARNNLTKITYADGSLVIYTYDTDDRLISMRDLRGTVTAFEYYENNLIKKITVGQRTTTYSYTAGQVTSVTDALGRVTLNAYNSAGYLVKTTDCQSKETTYTYDSAGNLLSVTDANGNVTANEYNAEGEIVKSTDAKGNVTAYTYNGNGKRTSITLPDGGTVMYEYDGEDRLTETVYPNGSATANIYDAVGRTVSSSDRNGYVTAYEYDVVGNVTKITNPVGGVTIKEYDALGRIIKTTEVVDPVDELPEDLFLDDDAEPTTQYNVTAFVYDRLGRMVKTVNAFGGETVYTYNGAGDVLTVKDPVGNTTVNTYNGYGELISVRDSKGNTTSYTYDGVGNLLTVKNALDQVTTNTYDSLNRLMSVTDPGGHTVSYEYDALGRNTKITNAKGKSTVTDYDALGNIIKITNALGHVDYTAVYDSMDRITETTDSAGSKTTYQYDLMGNVTKQTDALGYSYNYTYDNSGNLVSSIDKSGGISYSTYDGVGNITSVTGPMGAFTDYLYDTAGRMATSNSSTFGDDNMYTYNALGLIDRRWDRGYSVTKYNYDAAGRITSFENSSGTTSYTYDANGNVLTSTDGTGTVTREYDALNRVTKYTDIYGNVIRYEYNACGELVRMTYPTGEVGIYSYDANHNMVLSGMVGEDHNTTYEYNDLDKVKKVTNVDGSTVTKSYDSAGRVQVVNEKTKTGQFITACIYTYDEMGRISEEIDPIGLTTYSMTYDSMGRLITRTETDTRDNSVIGSETFTYDDAGNIISDSDGNTYEYGDNNRLTKYNNTPCTSTTKGSTDTYVQNGQTYSVTYDARNRLEKINGSYNQYWYDADNNRINMYYYSTNMQYTYDCSDGRSRLVWSNDHMSTVTTYAYGVEGLLWSRANGSYQVYHYDYRGSVVAVSDIDGNITDTLEYDAYGSISERTGTSKLIFTYNGQYGVLTDPNGLLYMRTRYYSPTYKRFMSEDVIYGNITDSSSLNRYSYVNGDPISFVDPFGLSKESGGNKITHGPSVLEAAYMARYTRNYNSVTPLELKGKWTFEKDQVIYGGDGLVICVYSRINSDGSIDYTLVNRGTVSWSITDTDVWNNLSQPFGWSNDMKDSIKLTKKFVEDHSTSGITFVGHSKGGAEAAANAVATNKNAILFNPASVNLNAYGLSEEDYSADMTAYIVEGEILNNLLGWVSEPIDKLVHLPNQGGSAIYNHYIDTVISALEEKGYN